MVSSYHCNSVTVLFKHNVGQELYSHTIGGTSGSCDIQSYFVYNAYNGGTKSAESSLDPFNEYITLPTYFVNQKYIVLNSINVDTHFVTERELVNS